MKLIFAIVQNDDSKRLTRALTKEGIRSLAPTVITMAEAEELTAHAEAARVRMA